MKNIAALYYNNEALQFCALSYHQVTLPPIGNQLPKPKSGLPPNTFIIQVKLYSNLKRKIYDTFLNI